jgi:hypothetical protein
MVTKSQNVNLSIISTIRPLLEGLSRTSFLNYTMFDATPSFALLVFPADTVVPV